MLHYKSIMIEGFQSFGKSTTINIDRKGINFIRGSNGSGKSTIFNALLWAEYGGNMKKSIATWDELRTENWRGTRVVIDRTDGHKDYRIVRHLDYTGTTFGMKGCSKLMIFEKDISKKKFDDTDLVGDALHKRDMQELIISQIGVDKDTFMKSVLFGQRMKSLVEASNAEKRVLFEELFYLDFVDGSRDRAKEEQSKLENQENKLQSDIDTSHTSVGNLTVEYDKSKKILRDFEDNQRDRVESAKYAYEEVGLDLAVLPKKIKSLKDKLNSYDELQLSDAESKLENCELTVGKLKTQSRDANTRVEEIQRELDKSDCNNVKYNSDLKEVDENCPYCKQDLPKSDVDKVKKEIKSKIKKEHDAIKLLKDGLTKADKYKIQAAESYKASVQDKDTLAAKVKEIKNGLTDYYEYKSDLKSLETEKNSLDKKLSEAKKRLEKEKNEPKPSIDLDYYINKIEYCSGQSKKCKEEIEGVSYKLEMVDWWVKVGFGSGGLKSFVFKAMLGQLNASMVKYSEKIGFSVEFSVDMDKKSKPFTTKVYKNGSVKDYEDLSGGQKQRVDICVAFAMHDLISIKTDINILVMDEFFEGMDREGIESAFEILRDKSEGKSLYVITHSDITDSINCKTIDVELDEDSNSILI